MHIGKKIKLLRQFRGLTQEDLAEKINKTRALVSHIEQTGKANYYTLQLITQVLNTNEEELELVGSTDKPYENPETDTKVEMLEEKLEQYKSENKMLKDMISSQKKLIQLLEKTK